MPVRIQRKRTKGYRLPPDAVYIGRPTRWGNPAQIGCWASVGSDWRNGQRQTMSTIIRSSREAVVYFRLAVRYGGLVVEDVDRTRFAVAVPVCDEIRDALAGQNLACWCPLGSPCHGDVLLRLANGSR